MRQLFSGTAERIFMKLLPNDRGDGVSNTVPKWGLGPRIIFWGLKTETSQKIAIGAYSSELRVVCLPRNGMQERGYLYGGCVKKA